METEITRRKIKSMAADKVPEATDQYTMAKSRLDAQWAAVGEADRQWALMLSCCLNSNSDKELIPPTAELAWLRQKLNELSAELMCYRLAVEKLAQLERWSHE